MPALYLEKTTLGEMSQPEVPSWAFSRRETEDLGEVTAAQDSLLHVVPPILIDGAKRHSSLSSLHLAGMHLANRFVATVKEWWAGRERERERLVLSLPLYGHTSLTRPEVTLTRKVNHPNRSGETARQKESRDNVDTV